MAVSFAELDTLFLDAGNTLVSMDFACLCELLAPLGIRTTPPALERAEAAARPEVSRLIGAGGSTEGRDFMVQYVRLVLRALGNGAPEDVDAVARALVATVRARLTTQQLWSNVLPGVREALVTLRSLGLTLVVVSNSDGTVEQGLIDRGLRPHVDAVVDSQVVGCEKPDPRIFRHALDLVGAHPERTLHVGDLFHVDVLGARAAGLEAVLLDPHGDWADVACERVPDVLALSRLIGAARR